MFRTLKERTKRFYNNARVRGAYSLLVFLNLFMYNYLRWHQGIKATPVVSLFEQYPKNKSKRLFIIKVIRYNMLIVALGSKNPVKLKATKQAFKILSKDIKVIQVEVNDLLLQPIGIKETVEGAVKRACIAINKIKEADFGVGIEGGLIECPYIQHGYLNSQAVAIVNRKFKLSLGLGPGFELPSEIISKIFSSKKELDKAAEEFVGEKDIGSKFGIIMNLTKGNLNRFEITRIAVIMALVPWLNIKHYKLSEVPNELLNSLNHSSKTVNTSTL